MDRQLDEDSSKDIGDDEIMAGMYF